MQSIDITNRRAGHPGSGAPGSHKIPMHRAVSLLPHAATAYVPAKVRHAYGFDQVANQTLDWTSKATDTLEKVKRARANLDNSPTA